MSIALAISPWTISLNVWGDISRLLHRVLAMPSGGGASTMVGVDLPLLSLLRFDIKTPHFP